MHLRDIRRLIEGTSDPAFIISAEGQIVDWNDGAADLLGKRQQDVIGVACHEVIRGIDETGTLCSEHCSVLEAAGKHNPVRNFDLQVTTPKGRQWCNVSVLIADDAGLKHPYTIHILRQINTRKRLELLVKDFLVSEIDLPEREAAAVIQSSRSPVGETELTQRELEILKLLATGQTSTAMGKALHISRNTVDNHVQHILKKLNAHSRLEAVRIAERAGLFIRSTNGNSTSGNGAHA